MQFSNYPPGVSGSEYEIAGGDDVREFDYECEGIQDVGDDTFPCQFSGPVEFELYQGVWAGACPRCGATVEFDDTDLKE